MILDSSSIDVVMYMNYKAVIFYVERFLANREVSVLKRLALLVFSHRSYVVPAACPR